MGKKPRPFVFDLTKKEAAELLQPSGEGGHQGLHEDLLAQLQNSNLVIQLTDAQLGKVIRYMTQYKSGGFQNRLRRAFKRSLVDLVSS